MSYYSTLSDSNTTLSRGGIIGKLFKNGQYEVIEKIGHGSFGAVYLIEDKLNNNEKYIKFILFSHYCIDRIVHLI